ncbi:unnamed protein product [Brassica napus]|uniref:(rape) hypothetical protein n=1 Tax=Brassica napus TaxID=3708 RepID=A0A816PKL7_BRANA|nr:unnamed protein product [Brassica napus]
MAMFDFEESLNKVQCSQSDMDKWFPEFESASKPSKGGRSIKPTQKVQEMEWTNVRGRGKKGRRSRGNHFH